MYIILTTNIKKLGKIGDVVKVKDGFARNFLIPNKMALRKNKKNLEHYQKIKENVEHEEKEKLQKAMSTIDEIKKLKIIFKKESDEKNQLYGSISKKEILNFLIENNIKINSDDVTIKEPIRSIGDHEIELNPYMGVVEKINITVQKN